MSVEQGNGRGVSSNGAGGGGWPTKLDETLPEPPRVPEGGTWRELAQICATALVAWYEWLKAVVEGMHFLRGTTARAAGQAQRAGDLAADARDEARGARVVALAVLKKLGGAVDAPGLGPDGLPHEPLPPMREPGISSHSLEAMVPQLAKAQTPAEVRSLIDEAITSREQSQKLARFEAREVERKKRWAKVAKWIGGVLASVASGYALSELKHLIHWH